jgi:hypothetical protein
MTQQIGDYPPSPAPGPPTTQVARDEAAAVGRTAADAGRQVAGTAAEQAGQVAQEVKAQARDLLGEARGQVQDQARTGQHKAAEGVRALSRELREMADGGERSGPVSEVARQAADRAENFAGWLGEREPADLLDEVRSLARRRPGAFLLGMAVAGVVVGRLTRGAVDSARADADATPRRAFGAPEYGGPTSGAPAYGGSAYSEPAYGGPAYSEPGYARTPGAPQPYDGPNAPFVPAGDLPPVAPGQYDTPTPPQGYPSPVADRLPQAPAVAPQGADPWTAPVDPVARPATGTVGEYVDEIEREAAQRRATGSDVPFDERHDDTTYRPGELR